MSTQDEPDVPEGPSHTLNDLLADFHTHSSSSFGPLASAQSSSWAFPSLSRASPPPFSSGPPSLLPRRTSSREHTVISVLAQDLASSISPGQQQTSFNTPTRSILSSGPPTSSVSANQAHASMSAPVPSNSSYPLSSLTVPSSSTSRKLGHYQGDIPSSSSRKVRLSRAEKDVDDPSNTMEDQRSAQRGNTTPTALSKLFATPEMPSPTVSRHASYIRTPSGTKYTRGEQKPTLQPDYANTINSNYL